MPYGKVVRGDDDFDSVETPYYLESFICWKHFGNSLGGDGSVFLKSKQISRQMVESDGWNGPEYKPNAIGFAIRSLRNLENDHYAPTTDYDPLFEYEKWGGENPATWVIEPREGKKLGSLYYEPLDPTLRLKI